MNKTLKTIWGTAKLNNYGYYVITSGKEGNHMKYLHRLIFENYHGVTLLPTTNIHHINGNKTDNSIENLEMMTHEEHSSSHKKGEDNPMYGKNHLLQTRQKISDAKKGKSHILETKRKMSIAHNTSGYYRVYKHKFKSCKQGFIWRYRYYDEDGKRKSISSVSIDKLEEKVKGNGLEWRKIDDM